MLLALPVLYCDGILCRPIPVHVRDDAPLRNWVKIGSYVVLSL